MNINIDNNALDIGLVKSAGSYFRVSDKEMNTIIDEVKSSIVDGQKIHKEIGISRNEQVLMNGAFEL